MPAFATTSQVSIAQLATRARRRSDHVNSTFVSDAEVEQYVIESYYELYDLLIESGGPEQFVDTHTFSTVAGQPAYDLVSGSGEQAAPLDIYKTLGVAVSLSGNVSDLTWIRRKPIFKYHDDNEQGWASASEVGYFMTTNLDKANDYGEQQYRQITFAPTPGGVHLVYLHFIPTPYVNTDPDSPSLILHYTHWGEYIVVDAAAKVLEKEESDASHLYKRKEELRQRILWHVNTMNHDDAGEVRDIYRAGRFRGLRNEPWS